MASINMLICWIDIDSCASGRFHKHIIDITLLIIWFVVN